MQYKSLQNGHLRSLHRHFHPRPSLTVPTPLLTSSQLQRHDISRTFSREIVSQIAHCNQYSSYLIKNMICVPAKQASKQSTSTFTGHHFQINNFSVKGNCCSSPNALKSTNMIWSCM
ncbi:hypothetical protein FKM82_017125 [Ascaphus truei]